MMGMNVMMITLSKILDNNNADDDDNDQFVQEDP